MSEKPWAEPDVNLIERMKLVYEGRRSGLDLVPSRESVLEALFAAHLDGLRLALRQVEAFAKDGGGTADECAGIIRAQLEHFERARKTLFARSWAVS